jgi:hypothetical protein
MKKSNYKNTLCATQKPAKLWIRFINNAKNFLSFNSRRAEFLGIVLPTVDTVLPQLVLEDIAEVFPLDKSCATVFYFDCIKSRPIRKWFNIFKMNIV